MLHGRLVCPLQRRPVPQPKAARWGNIKDAFDTARFCILFSQDTHPHLTLSAMAASSSSVRQVLASSQHLLARKASVASAGCRRMSSASAMTLPADEQTPIDLPQIFDIFDAPSRLGESSKMLARVATSRTAARPTPAPERPSSRTVKPLPAPIIYDGPARPSHVFNTQHIRLVHMQAPSSIESKGSVSTLPPPVVFDGPSRLRPYHRAGSQEESNSPTTLLIAAGAAGTLAYAAYDQLTQNPSRQRVKSSS